MRTLLFLVLFYCAQLILAQTALAPGDLAFVEYNADNPDNFSIVFLRTVDSGTAISFTDNGWLSSDSFRNTEGLLQWEATQSYSCGDVVEFDSLGSISLSASGDQLFAFQGSLLLPDFIAGINNEGAGIWQSTATNANTSAMPDSLQNGLSAIALTEMDNYAYTGLRSGAVTNIGSRLFADSNFTGHNSLQQQLGGSFSLSGCVLPVHFLTVDAIRLGAGIEVLWTTAQEVNSAYFEVQAGDGEAFYSLGTVPSIGDYAAISSYHSSYPNTKWDFVRVVHYDYDGQEMKSPLVKVSALRRSRVSYSGESWQIETEAGNPLRLHSIEGQLIRIYHADKRGFCRIDRIGLPSGVYLLEARGHHGSEYIKLYNP